MGDEFGTSGESHQYLKEQNACHDVEFNNLLESPQFLLNSPVGRPNSDNEKQEPSTETGKGKNAVTTHFEYSELDIQSNPKTKLHDGANNGEAVMQNLSNGDLSVDKKSIQLLESTEREKTLVSILELRSKFLYGEMDTRNLTDTNFYSVSSLEDMEKLQDLSTGKLKYEEPGNGDLVLFKTSLWWTRLGSFAMLSQYTLA